jgi:hypothetical protein
MTLRLAGPSARLWRKEFIPLALRSEFQVLVKVPVHVGIDVADGSGLWERRNALLLLDTFEHVCIQSTILYRSITTNLQNNRSGLF